MNLTREEKIVALYEWMLTDPYVAMLAFFEATSAHTFGLEEDEPIPSEVTKEYLERRLPELKEAFDKKQVLV